MIGPRAVILASTLLALIGAGAASAAGFTCRAEQIGLTCFNAMQQGFSLARAEQKVFSNSAT